jgi:hypothetical protein
MKRELYFLLVLFIPLVACKKNDLTTTPTIIYQDDFSIDKKTWSSDSTRLHVRKFYQGHYLIKEDSTNRFEYSLAPYGTINFPYTVQVDGIIQLDNPSQLGYIGIIFNRTDGTHYSVFQISNNGEYSLWTYSAGSFSTIVGWTLTSVIQTSYGSKNNIKISQEPQKVEIEINNNIIGSYSLPMPSGNIQTGILAGNVSGNYFTPTTGLFNNFILSKN